MIKCSECPRCKDVYPERVDHFGNHFYICGMSGNIVYKKPRREKKYSGKGYIHFSESSCGIYDTFEDVFNAMPKAAQKQWLLEKKKKAKMKARMGNEIQSCQILYVCLWG